MHDGTGGGVAQGGGQLGEARHPDFGKGTNDGQLWGYSKSSCKWIRCPLEGACCTIGVRMGGLASRPGHLTKKSLDNDCDSIALQA